MKRNRLNRFSETCALAELPKRLETGEEWDELIATPLGLIGITDLKGNLVPPVGDFESSVCLVLQSSVKENDLRVCRFDKLRANKVIEMEDS